VTIAGYRPCGDHERDAGAGEKESDIASFKPPDLRNLLVTAPYFHDGSQETLWDAAVDHYNKGDGLTNPWLDEDIQPLVLTEPEIKTSVLFWCGRARSTKY
jgi:cytochrome c peroxidase